MVHCGANISRVTSPSRTGSPHVSHTVRGVNGWSWWRIRIGGAVTAHLSPHVNSARMTGESSRPASVRWYPSPNRPGCPAGRRSSTPASTSVFSRAASRSRGAPVLRAIWLNWWLPNITSRTASSAHRSPTTSSAAASEQGRPGSVVGSRRMPPLSHAVVCFSNRRAVTVSGVTHSVGQSNRSRVATVVVVLAVFMTNLDLWIVNVALPEMSASFSRAGQPVSLGELSWVLNAYAITLAALLVVAGRLGDRIGQRPVFVGGIVVFTLASLACALAPTLWVLVAARVVQAAGAALQLPTSLALLLATVPAERRTGATRAWAAVGGLAAAAGPVLGGLLVQVDWRWVFVVNLPIGVLAVVAGLAALPRPAARETGPLPDLWGAVLVTLSVATLTGALVQAPAWGWTSGRTLGLLALAVLGAGWFWRRTAGHASPLLELHLLRLPRFGVANVGTFVFGVAFAMMLLSNVLWCQDVWHWSALRTGVALVPGPALVPIVTVLTARAARRFGHGPLVAVGGVLFAAGMLWRTVFVTIAPDYLRDLLPSMILTGAGVGLVLGTLVAAGVQSLPANRAATGSALINSFRQISAAVGVAVLVTILGSHVDPTSTADFRLAWALGAALSIATTAVGVLLTRDRAAEPVPVHS